MAIWSTQISISAAARVRTIGKHNPILTLNRTGACRNITQNRWILKTSPTPSAGTNASKQYHQDANGRVSKGVHSLAKHASYHFSTSSSSSQRGTRKLFRSASIIDPVHGGTGGTMQQLLRKNKLRNHANIHTPLAMDYFPTRSWYGQARLTPEQVNNILQKYEFSQKIENDNGSSVTFVSNQLPSNNPIEDRRAKAKSCLSNAMLFGVFDGHRGPACAQAISERLFNYIAAEVLPYDDLLKAHRLFDKGELHEMVEWFHHPNDYTSQERAFTYNRSLHKYLQDNVSVDISGEESVPEALVTAFERLDKDLSMEALTPASAVMYDEALHTVFSGACACIAYIDGSDLFVANAGDCKAVLGSQDVDGFWLANCLSTDHNAHNHDEIERLRGMHPPNESSTVIKNGRLLSELAPLRAFGDVRYKWAADTQRNVLNPWFGSEVVPRHYHTPPYLIASPEVQHHNLQPSDKFLILASDGLWDCMTPQRAVTLVGDHLLLQHSSGSFEKQQMRLGEIKQQLLHRRDALHPEDENAATHLIRYAVGGSQNEFHHDKLADSLSLPDDIARQYRDDITVIVVYF